jgi:hypothetical protein
MRPRPVDDGRRGVLDTAAQLTEAVTGAGELAGTYPLWHEWMSAPSGASMDEQLALSLTFLIDGIATRLPSGG